jgi:AcrR family transcriptional regulator
MMTSRNPAGDERARVEDDSSSAQPRNVDGEARQSSRRRSTEAKRQLIRSSAFRQFADSGFFPTTVDAICEDAGISKGSFYYHYESKQAVFLDILDGWAHKVESVMAENFRSAFASRGALSEFASAMEREADRCRRIIPVWLDFLSQVGRDSAIRDGMAIFHRRIRRAIQGLIEPVVTPALGKNATPAITGTILGAFIGLLCQDVTGDKDAEFSQQVRGFLAFTEELLHSAAMARSLSPTD